MGRSRGERIAVFVQIAVARREGRFWGKRVGTGRPFSTGLWRVKCGKSRGYGKDGREAGVVRNSRTPKSISEFFGVQRKVLYIKDLRIFLHLFAGT